MAEPESPHSDNGNGEQNTRIDRDMTPLRGPMKPNLARAVAVFGVILVGGLWYVLSSEEDSRRADRPRTVDPEEAQPIMPPREEQPPPTQPVLPPPAPVVQQPPVDPLAEQRARLLLTRIQRLQKEMDQRRNSKMLVVSDSSPGQPGTAPPAPADGGAFPPAPTLLGGAGDHTPRVGSVGPVQEQPAVQARLLRTTGYTITEGTVIPGVLETAINSDLPGLVRSINSADVFSHDGSQLLIPKGSRLVGRYQSDIRRGQTRVFIMWTRIIRADGLSILINSPGTDPLGRAGLEGDVDTHFFKIFGAAILLSILDGGIDVAVEMARRSGDNSTAIIQRDRGMSRAAELALEDSIRIQPTIHIDQGTRISILVARDLDFESVEMARAETQGQ